MFEKFIEELSLVVEQTGEVVAGDLGVDLLPYRAVNAVRPLAVK